MKKEKIVAVFIVFSSLFIVGGIVAAGWYLQTPIPGKKISALVIGAEYLGDENVVLQTKYNNCGPSALKMIFDHYNIVSTLDEIEKSVGLTEKGSTMLALKKMAELKGLQAEGWRLTLEDFVTKPFPVLLFVHNDHYIVADSVRNDEVFIRDPAIGRMKMNKNTLTNIWSGETIIFTHNNTH